jgi:hypothetical protein
MFDTPHPAHKPPAPDRLAPIEARGAVTDRILSAAQQICEQSNENDHGIYRVAAEHISELREALRARESAPAVEIPPNSA